MTALVCTLAFKTSKTLAEKRTINIPFPVLLFLGLLLKCQGKPQKHQGFSSPCQTLKTLETKQKALKKTKENRKPEQTSKLRVGFWQNGFFASLPKTSSGGQFLGFKISKSRGREGKLRQKRADKRKESRLGNMKTPTFLVFFLAILTLKLGKNCDS